MAVWGSLLAAMIASASLTACYGCGCCGVARNVARWFALTFGVLVATFVGVSVSVIVAMAAYELAWAAGGASSALVIAAFVLSCAAATYAWRRLAAALRRRGVSGGGAGVGVGARASSSPRLPRRV
jgi:hypothetical protein